MGVARNECWACMMTYCVQAAQLMANRSNFLLNNVILVNARPVQPSTTNLRQPAEASTACLLSLPASRHLHFVVQDDLM